MSCFGHCEQSMRCPAFELDIGFDPRKPTGRIEGSVNCKCTIKHKQGILHEAADIDGSTLAKHQLGLKERKLFNRFQWVACKALVTWLNRMSQVLPQVNLAAVQHG